MPKDGTSLLIEDVRREKYMQGHEDSWAASHDRVATSLFPADPDQASRLRRELAEGRACPAGRVMAGAGTGKNVTWWNCFVAPLLQDSMRTDPTRPGKGIMDALADVAYSMQMGGGVGTDFTPLRPHLALVRRVQAEASGPLSFMDMWDAMCRTIMSAGYRRGAMMATLACDHPDIEAFIEAKREPGRLRMFNLSVLVTDTFMRAVDQDLTWDLGHVEPPFDGSKIVEVQRRNGQDWFVYRRLPARDLWRKIMETTYRYSEPGVIFIDRVNRMNNLWYCEDIRCTNPCFSGDTLVWTINGPRRFDELAHDGLSIPVLTELDDGKLAYRDMLNPRVTQRDAKLVEITLKAKRGRGGREISITKLRVTPNHEFFAVGGYRIRADALRAGDRVESAYRTRANQKGYIAVRATNGDRAMEHHLVAEYDHGRRPNWPDEHGHHTDEIKDNNVSGNVEILLASVHNSENMIGDRNPMRRWYPNATEEERSQYHENTSNAVSGEGNGMFGRSHREDTRAKIGRKTRERFSDSDFKRRHKEAVRAGMARMTPQARARNHVVVSVESVEGSEDVYCGTVPATGKFFVSLGNDHYEGVLVSNCGEQPLPPDANCNLSHAVVSRCMRGTPFTEDCVVDLDAVAGTAAILVRMSDNVIDLSPVPTEAQRVEALAKRRIGLGVTALANSLMFVRKRYGSPEAVEETRAVMRALRDAAYRESILIAREKGPFPAFDRDKYLSGEFVRTLPEDILDGIAESGIRNALLLTIAPVGTQSIASAGNGSGGIEPVFLARYKRRKLAADGSFDEYSVEDPGFRAYADAMHRGDMDEALSNLPGYMVTTRDLSPEDHLVMMAAAQEFVDASISKTVNVPPDIPYDDFVGVYRRAYDLGCKSCTTYREVPDSGRGAVLTDDGEPPVVQQSQTIHPPLRKRPDMLDGRTYRMRWAALPYPMFMTVNDEVLPNGSRVPFEVFINSKAVDYAHWVSALTRMISAIMRKGGDLSFIPDELKQVWSARGGEFIDQKFVPSEIALIGRTLERHFRDVGYVVDPPTNGIAEHERELTGPAYAELGIGRECPSCGALQLVRAEDCDKCLACGYNKCG